MNIIINSIKRFFRIIFENILFKKSNIILDGNLKSNGIMSFNLRCDHNEDIEYNWTKRRSHIVDMIKDITPSIICFQECMPHMFKYLYKHLGKHYCVYGKSNHKLLDLFNRHNVTSWFNSGLAIFYDFKKFGYIDSKEYILKADPQEKGRNKILIELKLYDRESKQYITIYNTHLNLYSNKVRSENIYAISMMALTNLDYEKNDIYICGDFNCGRNFKGLSNLGFLKCSDDFIKGNKGTCNHFKERNKYAIDFIFTNRLINNAEIITKSYDIKFLSDHYPVIINL